MVLHNPNNWHWVTKDVLEWTKAYLEKDLESLYAEEDGVSARIDSLLSCDGDAEVSQRKGKVITLFDVSPSFAFSGKNKDGQAANGTIKIAELMHDTKPDELQFEITQYSESEENLPVKELVRKKIVPQMRQHLQRLAPALIEEHGKDLQHAPGSNPSSGFSTPRYISNAQHNKPDSKVLASSLSAHSNKQAVNTTTVTESSEYRTTAQELFTTFTDPQRLTAFTRSAPLVFDGAKPGGKFALFGGNVTGEYVELKEPSLLVQKWRLSQWPDGHFSNMKIRFEQNDRDGVTVMRVDWEGVPVGQEEVTKRNWGEYYVRSIKTTFGFGTVL